MYTDDRILLAQAIIDERIREAKGHRLAREARLTGDLRRDQQPEATPARTAPRRRRGFGLAGILHVRHAYR